MKPLKRPENHAVCEPKLVDAIFFQIPEIKQHHDKFFENVRNCFENWDTDAVKMGDLFMQSVSYFKSCQINHLNFTRIL